MKKRICILIVAVGLTTLGQAQAPRVAYRLTTAGVLTADGQEITLSPEATKAMIALSADLLGTEIPRHNPIYWRGAR